MQKNKEIGIKEKRGGRARRGKEERKMGKWK